MTGTLFILGAPKCGTGSLFRWLAAHPEVRPAARKETAAFADPGSHVYRPGQTGWGALEAAFEPGSEPWRVEASPVHLYARSALAEIPPAPGSRALVMLREPAAQVHSVFRYYRDHWGHVPARMGFAEYLRRVAEGTAWFAGNEIAEKSLHLAVYAPFLMSWKQAMGTRLRVMLLEDLRAEPARELDGLCDWLGIARRPAPLPHANPTGAPRSRMVEAVGRALRERLPKGPAYERLRALYRRANRRRLPATEAERALMAWLRPRYEEPNAALAAMGLDLARWSASASASASATMPAPEATPPAPPTAVRRAKTSTSSTGSAPAPAVARSAAP